jgi:hypothetical protein
VFAFCLALCALAGPALAASDGVPPVSGSWHGKFSSVFWDQTNGAALAPRFKYKAKVDVTITQVDDAIEMTINFPAIPAFPVDSTTAAAQLVLEGFVGNYHVNATHATGPTMVLSGFTNKKGNVLVFNGTAASGEFTHEIQMKLKRTGSAN